jgi:hypothetical protein
VRIGTVDIEAAVRELTNVRSIDTTTVVLYGRQKWAGPTKFKPAAVWELWHPYVEKPINIEATFIRDEIRSERDCDSPDHLLIVPLSHVKILGLEEFILSDEHVERIRERTRHSRPF